MDEMQIQLEQLFNKQKTLKKIDENTERLIVAPWNSSYVVVKVVMLNATQLSTCGNFSSLSLRKEDKELTFQDIIEIKNMQEAILKLSLIEPTFDEILEVVKAKDSVTRIENKLKECKNKLSMVNKKDNEDVLKKLEKEIESYEIYLGFLLPDDFVAYVTSFVNQKDFTDITKVTEQTLLEAALLAEHYHKAPSEFMKGIFTDKQKKDIDLEALRILMEYREKQTIENDHKKWIRGKKPRRKR